MPAHAAPLCFLTGVRPWGWACLLGEALVQFKGLCLKQFLPCKDTDFLDRKNQTFTLHPQCAMLMHGIWLTCSSTGTALSPAPRGRALPGSCGEVVL